MVAALGVWAVRLCVSSCRGEGEDETTREVLEMPSEVALAEMPRVVVQLLARVQQSPIPASGVSSWGVGAELMMVPGGQGEATSIELKWLVTLQGTIWDSMILFPSSEHGMITLLLVVAAQANMASIVSDGHKHLEPDLLASMGAAFLHGLNLLNFILKNHLQEKNLDLRLPDRQGEKTAPPGA